VNGSPTDPTKGVLTFSGKTIEKNRLYLSGVLYDFDGDATSCVNYAPINFSGKTGMTLHCGGLSATFVNPGKTWTECNNYGKITLSGEVGSSSVTGSDSGADTFVGGVCELITDSTSPCTFVRCGNYGDIEFTETFKSANATRSSGFYPRHESAGTAILEDCVNAGDFIFNGVSSARSGGNFKLAGGIASLDTSTITIKGSFINSGDVIVGGSNSRASVYVGGTFGQLSASCTLANGGETEVLIANTGKVTFTGSAKDLLRVGGIFAAANDGSVLDGTMKYVNIGDITVSGSYDAAQTGYVAGIIPNAYTSFANAESYGNITAYWLNNGAVTTYSGVGFITGAARTESFKVTNCKVGGTISTSYNALDEKDIIEKLNSSNYYNYIYGSGIDTDWTGTDNYDGCTLLTAAPTIQ
jgi:hypothetical protein